MAQWRAAFPEPSVRGESALDQDGPSRPFGDGRDAEVASQGLQFGFPDAVEGFGEDDGQDGGSDAGDGAQDADGLPAHHGNAVPDPTVGMRVSGAIPSRTAGPIREAENAKPGLDLPE